MRHAKRRALPLLLALALGPLASTARAAPPEKAVPNILITENPFTFPDSNTSISAKAFWLAYWVFCDVGPIDRLLIYHNHGTFRMSYPSPGFLGLYGAATDTGVVFLGRNVLTGRTQICILNLSDELKPPTFYDLVLDMTQGGFLFGNFLGDYIAGSYGDGRLAVHWHSMPEGEHQIITQIAAAKPVGAAYGWNSFYVANQNRTLLRVPYFGTPAAVPLSFTPASIAYGAAGEVFLSDAQQPKIWAFNGLTLAFITDYLVKAVTYFLAFTPSGYLMGFQSPRTLMFLDVLTRIELSYLLLGTAALFDYYFGPGLFPYLLFADEFDNALNKGIVRQLLISDDILNRDLVCDRREGEWQGLAQVSGRAIAITGDNGKEPR